MKFSPSRGVVVQVDDPTKVGAARRLTAELAGALGFEETRLGKASLITTEAATNLSKHAVGGELIIQGVVSAARGAAMEILALDTGPGIGDLARCFRDGFSGTGTSGTGLGAMKRLADAFDIHSQPGVGTALLARMESASPPDPTHRWAHFDFGAVNLAVAGEEVCGDGWAIVEREGRCHVMVVDGLGHGAAAAEAAGQAMIVFHERSDEEPEDLIRVLDTELRGTRGAAIAIARVDPKHGVVRHAGVGNVATTIVSRENGATKSLISHNGTVGYAIRKVQTIDYPWTDQSLLVMHSDGLATHWDLDRYAALRQQRPGLIAGVLYRDHRRPRDDVTVLVVGQHKGMSP